MQSGKTLAHAANSAAIIAGFGYWFVHSGPCAVLLAFSLLSWLFECWFAVRVAIDHAFLRLLEKHGEPGGEWLDSILIRWKLSKRRESRSVADRVRGAIRLWRMQGLAFGLQLLTLGAAVVLDAMS